MHSLLSAPGGLGEGTGKEMSNRSNCRQKDNNWAIKSRFYSWLLEGSPSLSFLATGGTPHHQENK